MKIQSPWMGRIKGSAGNMTGCKVYDKNVMRAKAFEVNNPNTAAQQVQRGYFADLTKLVAGFTPDQLRTLFPNKPKAMSRRNALAKQLAEYNDMDGNAKIIDFAEIDTLGNAPTMNFGETSVTVEQDSINVDINEFTRSNPQFASNYFVAVLINDSKKQISFTTESAKVSSESLDLAMPNGWESDDAVNAVALITDSAEAVTSFGSFIIKVRPEKKSN